MKFGKYFLPIVSAITLISLIFVLKGSLKTGQKDAIILETIGIFAAALLMIVCTIRAIKN
jgi:hypothetical protein